MAKKGQKYIKYSYELKKAVIEDSMRGLNATELMEKYGVLNDTQIETWLRIFRNKGLEGIKTKIKGRPKKSSNQSELEQLRMENDILKKIQKLLEQEKP